MRRRKQSIDCNFLRPARRWLMRFGLLALWGAATQAYSQDPRDSLAYLVQMASGDRFRANITAHDDSTLTLATEFGVVRVRKDLIARFLLADGPQIKGPNHFFMPTASPNGPGGFVSNYELGFFYGGVGFGNGATITAGMSTLPGIALSQQIFHLGAKFTVERNAGYELAVGAAYSFLTADYPYSHIYGVMTLPIGTARYSAMVFARVTGEDEAPIGIQAFNADTTRFTIFYTGSIGVALGFDAPAFGRDDIRWVGEIWNHDVQRPQNAVSIIGVRVLNDRLSADFGVGLFTLPFIVPVTRFSYRWY